MNITTEIAKQIGGEIETLINENKGIQFYANHNINGYQWRDTRFQESSDVWLNKDAKTRNDIIDIFKEHLVTHSS